MTQATYAKFASEVSDIKEQVELEQIKDDLYYSGSINDLLGINSTYNDKLILQEGELVYVSSNVSSREAKWFEQMGINKSSDYFTVEFDSAGGTEIATQSIKIGKKVNQPTNPTKEGYVFLGWYYLEEDGTEDNPTYEEREFDFSTEILKNYQIYAKYSGEAIMTSYKANQFFWKYKTEITSIKFTSDNSLIPSNIKESWNIKASNNCSDVMAYLENVTNVLVIYSPNTIYTNTNARQYFQGFSSLNMIDFENCDTSKTIVMRQMFEGCSNLTSLDVSKFNTKNVVNMQFLFYNCNSLKNLDLSNFDTNKVKTMYRMFSDCSSLESLEISNFDTSNVTNMSYLFNRCSSLKNLGVSNFNTKNVTVMYQMFNGCSSLTNLDVSNFDTSKVKTMRSMFNGCSSLTKIDLSNFDTKNVDSMFYMFNNCSNLEVIYASEKFITENVTESQRMFYGCTKLVGGKGTQYDSSHREKEYAHIDGGTENPGYFTLK